MRSAHEHIPPGVLQPLNRPNRAERRRMDKELRRAAKRGEFGEMAQQISQDPELRQLITPDVLEQMINHESGGQDE